MLSLVAGTHLHVSDDASLSGIPSRPQPKLDLVGAISFVEGPSLQLAGHPRLEEVMKYARLTAITILLPASAADTADAVAYKDIAYDELAQAAGEQPQWPISSATSLADWAVARAREAA